MVEVHPNQAIVSLIANVDRSSELLSIVFDVLKREGIQVQMLSQGASKVNISLIVRDEDADKTIQILHDQFFGKGEAEKQ